MGAYERGSCRADKFLRSDGNGDGKLDVSDPVYTLLFVFRNGSAPPCLAAADANDDGAVDLADPVFTLQHLFIAGPTIPAPYPACGVDPTLDDLTCASPPPCP
jgi:hypothetical protein